MSSSELEETKLHEISFLALEENIEPIGKLIEKTGAVIEKNSMRPVVKIKLAYPIRKSSYAFLGIIRFEGGGENIRKINEEIKLQSGVLRYILTKVGKSTSQPKNLKPILAKSRVMMRSARKPEVAPILTNEALQEKIEEILK